SEGPVEMGQQMAAALRIGEGVGEDRRRETHGIPHGRTGPALAAVDAADSTSESRPFSIASSTSHVVSVLGRWAIMKVVRPCMRRSIASMIAASVLISTELVGSSRMRMGA